MKTYEFDLLNNGLKEFNGFMEHLKKILLSDDFKQFLLKKCQQSLKNICDMNFPLPNEYGNDVNYYLDNMKTEIGEDYIMLYNDSEIDINKKNMSKTTKEKYPFKLSLAKIIEYGIGATGASSPFAFVTEDWEYDVNNHGENGWYYRDEIGTLFWSNGFEGRFIFYKLTQNIKENVTEWINEYIINNL